jgi:hypothetical protein
MAYNLRGLVWLGVRHDEFALAARILGTLDALGGMLQHLPGFVTSAYEANVATVRTALGEESFTKERETGRVQSMEVTIAEAIALADRLMAKQR